MFCVVTNVDRISQDTVQKVKKSLSSELRIAKENILPVSNYTYRDMYSDGRTKPDKRMQKLALTALLRLLQPSRNKPATAGYLIVVLKSSCFVYSLQ